MKTQTTKSASQRGSLFDSIRNLADEVTGEKQAAAKPVAKPGMPKQAAPIPSDPGGYQGASSHPSADADNHGQAEQTGARSSENESDVKEDQPVGVDKAPENKPGDQDSVQLNIGTTQSATGEDASAEDAYKGDKEDPGTSHPATTEDGEKYGSLSIKQAKVLADHKANEILADLANGFGNRLQKSAQQPAQKPAGKPAPAPQKTAAAKPAPAAQPTGSVNPQLLKDAQAAAAKPAPQLRPGYELANALGLDKAAAEANVQQVIRDTIKEAQDDADRFGTYYKALQNRVKSAGDPASGAAEGEDHSGKDDATSGAGDSPSEGGGGGGGGGSPSPDDGGADGASLGDILGGGGGGGGGAPMGGDPSQDQALMQLAAALDELGIPLDALAAAAPSGGGGGGGMGGGAPPMGGGGPPPMDPMMGGGAPPMGGGAPPPPMPPMGGGGGPPGMEVAAKYVERVKLARAVQNFKQSGRYQMKAAATPAERELRNIMRNYVQELMAR